MQLKGVGYRRMVFFGQKKTEIPVAPIRLLKLISCGCKTGCQKISLCSCVRFGIKCTALCSGCNGASCFNVEEITMEED